MVLVLDGHVRKGSHQRSAEAGGIDDEEDQDHQRATRTRTHPQGVV